MKISRAGLWSAVKMMHIVGTVIAIIIPSHVMHNEQNIQVTLKAGKSYEIKNSSTDKNVRINSDRNSQKKFDLATRGADGHVQLISRDYSSRSFTVDRTTSVIVTVY